MVQTSREKNRLRLLVVEIPIIYQGFLAPIQPSGFFPRISEGSEIQYLILVLHLFT